MANYLDGRWLFGVGFVPPSARYVPDLPNGSIRNGDFGAINGVMTMGFVGTTLLYGPLLLMLGMWVIGGGRQSAAAAVAFGLVLWGTAVLASSPTSGPLFTISGVALVALVLGYAGYAMSPRPGS